MDQSQEDIIYFTPPLTRWMYYKARNHYKKHGHGFKPFTTTKHYRYRWDLELLQMIIEFILSTDNVQHVAFGKQFFIHFR